MRRVSDRKTFEALRTRANKARFGPVSVAFHRADADGRSEVRVAYAVGTRVGRAVQRNRLRRRLRAAVGDLKGLEQGAYLVSAGREAAGMRYGELKGALGHAMAQASERSEADAHEQ
ncbi:MAG: ribonuclease P protein component [Nitrososphaerales archaeon]